MIWNAANMDRCADQPWARHSWHRSINMVYMDRLTPPCYGPDLLYSSLDHVGTRIESLYLQEPKSLVKGILIISPPRYEPAVAKALKGIYTPAGSLTFSNSGLPDHHSPTLWHWMLIILILLIHVTTRQQWNASWQSKRRRNGTNSEHSHCGCRPRNSWVTRNDRVHEGQWNG